jgi:hypothetical protein
MVIKPKNYLEGKSKAVSVGVSRQAFFTKLRPLVIALMLLLFFLSAAGFVLMLPTALNGHVDFRSFYTAGYMVRTAHGPEIYDYEQTQKFQNELVGPAKGALPFNHLAYESLIDLPFSFLSYRGAYFAFLAVNLMFLAASIYMLRPYLAPLAKLWYLLPTAFVVCFLPVTMALIEGQDSLLLLALLLASTVALDNQRELRAGMLLGLTLFKFQYALPIALLFFVWRRWRFLAGFAISGAIIAGTSFAVLGYSGVLSYVHYLPGASSKFSAVNDVLYGIHPEGMPNLRGLAHVTSGGSTSVTNFVTLASSCAVLLWAAFKRPSLPAALLAALLVSFHQMIADFSLLLLPLGLAVAQLFEETGPRRLWIGILAFLAFAGPAVLLFAGARFYLLVLPVLGLFILLNQAAGPSPKDGKVTTGCPQTVT